jgi:hypothetical protein
MSNFGRLSPSSSLNVGKETAMRKGLAVLLLLMMSCFAGASQDLGGLRMPKAIFDIPFQFHADENLMPAGIYEMMPNAVGTHLELRNVKGEETLIVSAITQLGGRMVDKAEVVFDVVGRDHYLSEFYMAGMDGLAFNGAPGKHTHQGIEPRK